MKRYRITLGGQTFDVRVLGDPRQKEVQVAVDGEILTVGVKTPSIPPEGTTAEPIAECVSATTAPVPSGTEAAVLSTDRHYQWVDNLWLKSRP